MKRVMILLGAILIIVVVGFLGWNQINNARAAQKTYGPDDVVTIQRSTLIATVSATGSIAPEKSSDLGFLTSGNLAQTFLKQGETVKAGQAIAKLDTKELELQLAQAEANLNLAQSKLDQLKRGGTDTAVAAAQANVTSAQSAYDKLLHPDPNDVKMARSDLDKAKAALDQAQAAYDRIGGASNPNIGLLPQSLQLQQATDDYQKALAAYNAKFTPSDSQLKAAQAQIQTAKDQLARLSPTGDDLAQAQANVDASRAARDLAKQRVDEGTLYAPFDGTIVTMDLNPGEAVQLGKPVVTVADLQHLQIKLNIDETDIPHVALGQTAALDLDAFPGQNIQGKVVDIAPGAQTVQGVVNYEVRIEVQPSQVPLKSGMTANASIEVLRKDNVLLVPNRAIRASNNKRLVTILENGQPKEVPVTLGLSNDQETEVLSGLNEGQQVLTTATQTVPNFGPPSGGSGS